MSLWWQRGIIYQVYPRSFMDSNGDGVGDLAGVLSRLDYLRWLGVDALWLSPIYPSPMKDFGYDVADYTGVDPLFGTLSDFDRLVQAAHARGLKVILDFVPNHTSDEHAWFKAARRSRDDPKRDWYLWRDPAPDGGPPNNWLSCFGGSAWTYDPNTAQYYYHAFLPGQPDLNWRNPQLAEAMLGVLRFWLERGVDGFRVDVLWHLMKHADFPDNPVNPAWRAGMDPYQALVPLYTTDLPEVHGIVARMRRLLDEYRERALIGEIYLPVERLVKYYGAGLQGAHLPFNFQLVQAPWDAAHLARLVEEYERALPECAWPNWVLGNHDQRRLASRLGDGQARVAMLLLLTLRGTPTIYYGDELGLPNAEIRPDQVRDPWGLVEPGQGRDPGRSPMPWDGSPNGAFTTPDVDPWLPLAPGHKTTNVALQREDPASLLSMTRRLLELRRGHPALAEGVHRSMDGTPDGTFCFVRSIDGSEGAPAVLVALNLTGEPRRVELDPGTGRVIEGTHPDRLGVTVDTASVDLRPDEGLVIELTAR